MPLPLTVSCSSKIQIGFTFLVPAHPGSPGQRAIKRVCVCEYSLIIIIADVLGCLILLLILLTAVFNVGEYRRKAAPHSINNSDFFRPGNKDAQEIREYDFTIAMFLCS